MRTTIALPRYCPGLALKEHHFFRPLSKDLRGQGFDKERALKVDTGSFFAQRSAGFRESGILSLPDRWRAAIDTNRAYKVDG